MKKETEYIIKQIAYTLLYISLVGTGATYFYDKKVAGLICICIGIYMFGHQYLDNQYLKVEVKK